MNLTDKIKSTYKPSMALIVYTDGGREYYIESHQLELVGGKAVLAAGVPLMESTLNEVVEFFKGKQTEESRIKGEVPENVLYCDWSVSRKILVWYNLPIQRNMFFSKQLSIPNGVAYQPGLIYVVNNNHLSVYAVGLPGRPSPDYELFRAPYHNVSGSGSVCLGSARVQKPRTITYGSVIHYYETLFWASEFSHLAGSETPIKGNVNTYWKNAVKSRKPFDTSVLAAAGKKRTQLKDLIKSLSL